MPWCLLTCLFFFQAEDGIRDLVRSRGLGDVYKRQLKGREDEIAWVDWPSDEILRDIDTPEDYAAAQGLSLIHI